MVAKELIRNRLFPRMEGREKLRVAAQFRVVLHKGKTTTTPPSVLLGHIYAINFSN